MSPTNLRVRSAQLSDLDDLVALEEHSFTSDRLSRAQFRRHLDSDSAKVLVASTGPHRFLGTAVVFFRKRSGVARLYSIATHHAARGQGVGSILLDAVEELARRRHCRALRLEVRADNASAIRLYERLGYHRVSALAEYYEDGADGWRYEKSLG
ncbi:MULTISPECIES: GNAT family N-acetyltransferase [Rhodanobacter]|uniref:GNAT family N-acetyltransferase n=1 Tax=Rhodanobacter hydrolyticus TaxID=2250595 RepID=A0ABW8J764_9GAMM|nr:GNAT family N-acetyltransferase [Rhodanobacter sp. 7MK24]MBD8881650.1 GNAT family N-acetyltransferase [Rhodanobacter sp. 7MK24]